MSPEKAAAVRAETIAEREKQREIKEREGARKGGQATADAKYAKRLFTQLIPSAAPLDLGDDCAEMLRSCWERRRNYAQDFTQLDIDRLCAAFRGIGKNGAP